MLGKGGGWKPSQPTHNPRHDHPPDPPKEGLWVHHTGSMGQHWGMESLRDGLAGPNPPHPLQAPHMGVPVLIGTQAPVQIPWSQPCLLLSSAVAMGEGRAALQG